VGGGVGGVGCEGGLVVGVVGGAGGIGGEGGLVVGVVGGEGGSGPGCSRTTSRDRPSTQSVWEITMSSQTTQLTRMTRAIEALRKQPLRTVQLADILECSERTVIRIIQAIRDADLSWAQIKTEERREPRGRSFERYYSIKQGEK
jgi:hypothetical protein